MRIDKLHLANFRGFESIDVEFDSSFNVVIGDNGTGKTSILEALCVALGAFLLKIDHPEVKARHIHEEDIRKVIHEHSNESIVPVSVVTEGEVIGRNNVQWKRELLSHAGKRTTIKDAKEISQIGEELTNSVRNEEAVTLPLIAYYSTSRLQIERSDTRDFKRGSRLQGYYNALNVKANNKFFTKWFANAHYAKNSTGTPPWELEVIKQAVALCIPQCKRFFYDFSSTDIQLELEDGKILPLSLLSDGFKNMIAMVADIAFRCAILNPQLAAKAALETNGVVLIDELDLHLHPAWQQRVCMDLQEAFPNIQFITTTHAPLILSGLKGRVIKFDNTGEVMYENQVFGRDANDILNLNMNTSERKKAIDERFDQYFSLIESGKGETAEAIDIREKLEESCGKDYHEFAKADTLITFYR